MYTFVCVCMYACMHALKLESAINEYKVCIYVYVCSVYVCTCVCVCMCVYVCMYVCIYVCMYASKSEPDP